jgi:hypothetical protein
MILPNVFSFLRSGFHLAPRFLTPLLHSGTFRRLFSPSVLYDRVPYTVQELHGEPTVRGTLRPDANPQTGPSVLQSSLPLPLR